MKPFFILLYVISALFCASAQDSSKTNIALLDLETRGGLSTDEVLSVSDRLRGELIGTGKFSVFERGQMDEILKEQGFQQSGACSEASCIVEVGQLLAVHKMVGGSIGKVGKAYSINLKVIDVATGEIEKQLSDDIRCTKEELVSRHMRNFAYRLAGMKTKKSFTDKWYIWTPALVAVGGGAAAAVILLNKDLESQQPEQSRPLQLEIPLQ